MKSLACGAGWRKLEYTHIVTGLPSIYLVVLIGIIVGWFGIIIWRFSCCCSLIGIIIRWFGIIIGCSEWFDYWIEIIIRWFGIIIYGCRRCGCVYWRLTHGVFLVCLTRRVVGITLLVCVISEWLYAVD